MLKSDATLCSAWSASVPEDLRPEIRRADVEEPHRRQDRAGERLLDLDVLIDDVGVIQQPLIDDPVDVATVEVLVEANAAECRVRVERAQPAKWRARTREKVRRQAQEHAGDQDEHERDEVEASRARFVS
jgi:hypothetical protein